MVRKRKKNVPALLRRYMDMDNVAPELSKMKLAEIALDVINEVEIDIASRNEWLQQLEKALKIANQEIEPKNTPWPGAANTKYPLLLKAAMQFNAFTLPQVIKDGRVVNVEVMLDEPTEEQEDRAERLEEHMSYQLTEQVPNWKSDTDKLLMCLSMHGVVYRKSYFDPINKRPQIDFCLPRDIVINNNTESLEKASRITHLLYLSTNDIISRMRAGLYTEYELNELLGTDNEDEADEENTTDCDLPYEGKNYLGKQVLYEMHKYLDLDEDGYREPYIVTVHKDSQNVMRIKANFDEDSFEFEEGKEEFICINKTEVFTDYHFIPAPDGTFHSLGFGHMLYPLNETINSITNQLLDAGTLANRGGGFISNGLRINKGPEKFVLGEFKKINLMPGQTLSQNIFPLPVKEGSTTLFNLLQFLLQGAESIGNIAQLMDGNKIPANTAATTVLAMIEQGSKVYSAMIIRLHESLKKEYGKLYRINKKYLAYYEDYALATKSGQIKLEDYQEPKYALIPVIDPSVASDMHRLMRAQALLQIAENPLFAAAGKDPHAHEIMRRYLEALHIANIDQILPKPPTPQEMKQIPPSPEEQMAELQLHKTVSEIKNIDADTAKKTMEKTGILMDKELEAISLDLQDEKQQANAAFMGANATEAKINSIEKMVQIDAQVPPERVAVAEQQVEEISPKLEAPAADIDMRIRMIEDSLQQVIGIGPQTQQQGSAQMPQGQQEVPPGQPEGAPQGVSAPPEQEEGQPES